MWSGGSYELIVLLVISWLFLVDKESHMISVTVEIYVEFCILILAVIS